ncbi:MAG: PRC-barrel domain-containing protein [Sulfitobacter sp.]|nr:PRC-barrel domain-containing protein [Sulfitobacter sp.]
MKRFLSTTAILLTLSGAAFADAHSNKTAGVGTETYQQGDFYASDLIGMRIYNVETEMDTNTRIADGAEREWDDIGEINDIIVSQDGDVRAVILGVGGFLGMGEKDVSVSMDGIKVVQEEGDMGDRFLVVTTSKEMLENAPAFDREADSEVMSTETAETKEEVQEPALIRPAMERDGYAEADMNEVQQLTSDMIEGSYVYGANDETVGEIDALLMSEDGKVEQAVINVGGFLGLGEKPVAVKFEQIQVLKNEDGDGYRFYIDSTEEKLEAMPEYKN